MNPRQQGHALITLYKKLYNEKYGHPPVINSYALIYGFMDAAKDLEYANARKALDYYFTCDSPGHTPENYLRKYVDLHKMRLDVEKDRQYRARLLRETAERVQRMEERRGNDTGTAD